MSLLNLKNKFEDLITELETDSNINKEVCNENFLSGFRYDSEAGKLISTQQAQQAQQALQAQQAIASRNAARANPFIGTVTAQTAQTAPETQAAAVTGTVTQPATGPSDGDKKKFYCELVNFNSRIDKNEDITLDDLTSLKKVALGITNISSIPNYEKNFLEPLDATISYYKLSSGSKLVDLQQEIINFKNKYNKHKEKIDEYIKQLNGIPDDENIIKKFISDIKTDALEIVDTINQLKDKIEEIKNKTQSTFSNIDGSISSTTDNSERERLHSKKTSIDKKYDDINELIKKKRRTIIAFIVINVIMGLILIYGLYLVINNKSNLSSNINNSIFK